MYKILDMNFDPKLKRKWVYRYFFVYYWLKYWLVIDVYEIVISKEKVDWKVNGEFGEEAGTCPMGPISHAWEV